MQMEKDYWNHYYAKSRKRAAPTVPSQFATFVANELGGLDPLFIDIGCGNGRDSLFFANYGFNVVGIDASEEAIHGCVARNDGKTNASFLCRDLTDPKLVDEIKEMRGERPIVLYARFFLHAIDEEAEAQVLKLAQSICGSTGLVAAEFRTDKDEVQSKVTDAHYRRFINPIDFLGRASQFGFSSTYFTEGFGYAKFRNDDAHVARIFLSPNGTSAA